jgi:hypothetical protein
MEEELDTEYLEELLKDPKNQIFYDLANHVLDNAYTECCEQLLLNIEKCRVYVDCIEGLYSFPTLVQQETEGSTSFEEYKIILLSTTSALFEDCSLVRHMKEVYKDKQEIFTSKIWTQSLSLEENLFQLIIVSSRIFERCDGDNDQVTLIINFYECISSLAEILALLKTIPMEIDMSRFAEILKSLDYVKSKDELDVFAYLKIFNIG